MSISLRKVIHFPGFEPLDAGEHHERYRRSAKQASAVWNVRFETGQLQDFRFRVEGQGPNWLTRSDVIIVDHDGLIERLRSGTVLAQIALGYRAAFAVAVEGGMVGYFRHAWRFGLFFVFPFMLVFAAMLLALQIAALPLIGGWNPFYLLWSVPAGLLFLFRLFLPWSDRLHTLHLFADWRLAVDAARYEDAVTLAWIDRASTVLEEALSEEADEYLVTAHSMGASLALHALGALLERNPDALKGKNVVFVTLGGAALQCALLKSARILRDRIRRVAECPDILWFEIQSLTDPVHLYKARTVAASGFPRVPQPAIVPFRFRTVLSDERYRRVKTDILRMHRQYVLGPDRRGSFDFTLMTAGPFPARQFMDFGPKSLPPIGEDGAI